MPPKQKDIQVPVKNDAHWEQLISPDNPRLVICDLHLKWCGKCQVIYQSFMKMFLLIDNAEDKIQFCDAIYENIEALQKYEVTCKPKFLIYYQGELLEEIDGPDIVRIMECVKTNMPQPQEE